MAFDREDTLKKAEKLLRQGRLDAAIAEYARVVDDQPRDWNTANTLGDLYARAGDPEKAAATYARIADHLMHEGFYPRAAALYKKILKIKPDDEATQLNLGEISARLGLLLDAKSYFATVEERRRARGDHAGADEIVVRLGTLDPTDFDARMTGAMTLAGRGDAIGAALRLREIHADLLERGRGREALAALREAVRLNPDDAGGRLELARDAMASGDIEAARTYLDRETTGKDPALLLALVDLELQSGALDEVRVLLPRLMSLGAGVRDRVVDLAWTAGAHSPEGSFLCIDAVVDGSTAAGDYVGAAAVLQEFTARLPGHIAALLKLVEVCVDGGLEEMMYETQAQLADAYLVAGQGVEARAMAEDLVAREPWEGSHIERFRKALVMLKVSDPDTLIAERLSGHAPFMTRDPFAGSAAESARSAGAAPPESEPQTAPAETAPEPKTEAPATSVPEPEARKRAGPAEADITRLLGDSEGTRDMPTPPEGQNLDGVFQDFRKEVSRQAGSEEAGQHLKLAQTYLEMGMVDEAVGPLETAARSPRHRFEAAALLGRLYRDRQDAAHAIEWLERAAEAPAPGVEDGRALLYDLGTTLEGAGETARALAVLMELQADAGDYRDVAARVDRLAKVQTGG